MPFDALPELEKLDIDLPSICHNISQHIVECQIRGLTKSCRSLTDLLTSLHEHDDKLMSVSQFSEGLSSAYQKLNAKELVHYLQARTLVDCGEYDRATHKLRPLITQRVFNGNFKLNPLISFLHAYSRYLAIEKRASNDQLELRKAYAATEDDADAKEAAENDSLPRLKSLTALKDDIEANLSPEDTSEDPYLLYLNGLVLVKLRRNADALDLFVRAIQQDPSLWCAWLRLSTLIPNRESLDRLLSGPFRASSFWMKYFFELKTCLLLHENERALEIGGRLSMSGFSQSIELRTDIALLYDSLRSTEAAHILFQEVFESDPYMLDAVDVYANVLFVRERSAELAKLAHHCVQVNKYLPQTCCVVGNFYGLRGQHDKALLYFQRALRLKPDYSLVWMLIGHEYVELRVINGAMHAYQQSIKHNPLEYRAWYGLGQMYELLNVPSFAIRYYQEAQYLFPIDSRPLIALGDMYDKLNRRKEARKCFWRAYAVGDSEGGAALTRLAHCYELEKDDTKAAAAYIQFIKLCEKNGVQNESDLAQAYKAMVHFCISRKRYRDAQLAANRCLDFRETKEEAKNLLHQIAYFMCNQEPVAMDQQPTESIFDADNQMFQRTMEQELIAERSKVAGEMAQPPETPVVRVGGVEERGRVPLPPEILLGVNESKNIVPSRDASQGATVASDLHMSEADKYYRRGEAAGNLSAVEQALSRYRDQLTEAQTRLADERQTTPTDAS